MLITQEIFFKWCSSAQNPIGDYGVFENIEGHIISAKALLCSILGKELYDSLTEVALEDPEDHLHAIANFSQQWICLEAYDRAIPHLDLTLSSSGFGVVSNGNVAPASADRVERLRSEVRKRRDYAFDSLLDSLRGCEQWHDSSEARMYFHTLIWNSKQLLICGYPDYDRSLLSKLAPRIEHAHRELKHLVSPELVLQWLRDLRHNSLTGYDKIAVDFAIMFMAALIDVNAKDVQSAKSSFLAFLDANITHFPTYRESSAYEANHFQHYENQKKDSCYFFG